MYWKSAVVLMAVSALPAGAAFAQSTPPPTPKEGDKPAASDTMKEKKGATGQESMTSKTKRVIKEGVEASKPGPREGQVRAVQLALKEQGHDPGPIDGIMGPKTEAALTSFQKSKGLKDTGRLDDDTLSKLGLAAEQKKQSQ